jgi:hypothetical protein
MKAMILVALAATACAPAEAPGEVDPIRTCNAAALASMVGRAWSDSLRPEALRLSGARAARVIRPGDMVTMDYRGDRLNVHLTAEGRIERFDCG